MILNGMQENIEIVIQTFGTEELLDLTRQSAVGKLLVAIQAAY
jgi:hypothetical protein